MNARRCFTFILHHEIRHVCSVVARQDGDFDHVTLRNVNEILARSDGSARQSAPCRQRDVVPGAGFAVRCDRLANDRQRWTRCRVESSRQPRRRPGGWSHAAAARGWHQGEVEQAETDRLTRLRLHPPRTVNSAAAGRFSDEVSNVARSRK